MVKFRVESIKEIQKERGLTRYAFAREIKTSSNLVKDWENEIVVPGTVLICRMCDTFGKDIAFFFAEEEG